MRAAVNKVKKKKSPSERAEECIRAYHDVGEDTDLLGSYTGIFRASGMGAPVFAPYDCNTAVDKPVPVQDADDL